METDRWRLLFVSICDIRLDVECCQKVCDRIALPKHRGSNPNLSPSHVSVCNVGG